MVAGGELDHDVCAAMHDLGEVELGGVAPQPEGVTDRVPHLLQLHVRGVVQQPAARTGE